MTTELANEIASVIAEPRADGYYVLWNHVFLGRWMRHGWRHAWMLRLFRKGRGAYEDLGMRGEGGWDNEVNKELRRRCYRQAPITIGARSVRRRHLMGREAEPVLNVERAAAVPEFGRARPRERPLRATR